MCAAAADAFWQCSQKAPVPMVACYDQRVALNLCRSEKEEVLKAKRARWMDEQLKMFAERPADEMQTQK